MDFYGSLELTSIPKRLIKEVNGKLYLNIRVIERKQLGKFGDSHFIVASCKKEDEVEGENLFIGNLKPFSQPSSPVTPEVVASAPQAQAGLIDELPF